ncbi:coilin [Cataglyphis hispanica]|uniref:coilin n=1 Tax=Cataglyphis hispanica TaxID=1086592 RepID=UPI00217FBE3E|nr:coilin [Cataglyphis hispanica]
MIHTEGVTMKHPHFRLKIDLSKFFHDARQFCWIFIDGIKIQQIFHIQQHISKLFSITEPFHLLLNTEYLPPTEDVRILKENETIQVVPGSGIKNEVDKAETCNGSMHDKQVHTIDMKTRVTASDALNVSNNTLNDTQPTSINNTAGNMTFYSVIDDTAIDDTEEDTDSKITDNNLTEDCNVTDSVISIPKRKRVRRRRPKNQSKTEFTLSFNMNEENKPKKPKIIDSYIIPSGKHIRFDNVEKEENNIAKQIVQEISRNESCISKTSSPQDLCTLLALGQSSTPITFVHKKVKNEVKVENELNDGIKNKNLNKNENNISIEKNLNNKEKTQCYENWIHSDPEIIPIMTRKPQVKDIIAFKTLKMGADYTPQLSNFIVTEVVDFCAHSANYYLKIIKGKEEVQVPFGKFSLSEDTSDSPCDTDTFLLKSSQICEPRLLAPFSSVL